jgi:hypothetical protein
MAIIIEELGMPYKNGITVMVYEADVVLGSKLARIF